MYNVERIRQIFEDYKIKYVEQNEEDFIVYFTTLDGRNYKFAKLTMIVDRHDMWDGYFLTTYDFYKSLDWETTDWLHKVIKCMRYMEIKILLLHLVKKNPQVPIGRLPTEIL